MQYACAELQNAVLFTSFLAMHHAALLSCTYCRSFWQVCDDAATVPDVTMII